MQHSCCNPHVNWFLSRIWESTASPSGGFLTSCPVHHLPPPSHCLGPRTLKMRWCSELFELLWQVVGNSRSGLIKLSLSSFLTPKCHVNFFIKKGNFAKWPKPEQLLLSLSGEWEFSYRWAARPIPLWSQVIIVNNVGATCVSESSSSALLIGGQVFLCKQNIPSAGSK